MPRRASERQRVEIVPKKRVRLSSKDTKHEASPESNSKIIGDEAGKKTGLHKWCNMYPGALPSLATPSANADGNKWNLKLVSWNINGLKAWIKSNGTDYIKEELPDILCLQEIKCALQDIPSGTKLSGYSSHWNSAEKKGYAGTGLYSKLKPLRVTNGIKKKAHNAEGRVITAEYENFYFVTAYVPNSGQGLVRLGYREKEWDPDFADYLKQLDEEKPIIVCGDLNVAHEEIDLANPHSNHKTAGFTDQERNGFNTLLKKVDLVDTYRHIYPEREKAYSFWSYRSNARPSNTGWRLDYFLVSKRLLPHVCDQEIRCGVHGSDHCPLVLYMHF